MENHLRSSIKAFVLLFFWLVAQSCFGQEEPELSGSSGIFDLFKAEDITEVELKADFDLLLGNLRSKDYLIGEMTVELSRKKTWAIPVKLRPRGKFRRMKCVFPPIKMKFEKEDLTARSLNHFNELKLVTHCMDKPDLDREMLLREYLIYKLYNVLTPHSFRVKLLRISYKNMGSEFKNTKQLAILIEDTDQMATRNGGAVVSRMGIPLDSLHTVQERISSMFQYMIGNADWSYLLARNMEFVTDQKGMIMPVPYDFDFSGIVGAPYATGLKSYGQISVRDRVFLGNACDREDLRGVCSYFKSKKKELLDTVYGFDYLSKAAREDIASYIESFYEIIADDGRIDAELIGTKKE